MCRILILSVTTGEGHNSAARAIKTYMEARGAQCCILDAYECVSHTAKVLIDHGYLLGASRMKGLYGIGYRMAEKRRGGADRRTFLRMLHTGYAKRLLRQIEEFDPDAIVTTHCLAGLMLDIIRRRGWKSRAKLVGVVTDFTVHPYWEECTSLDALVVASPLLEDEALNKGFEREKIFGLGIPIAPKFSVEGDRSQARAALGLDAQKKVVLVMGGSMGHGHFARTVRMIDALALDLQIVCVCGRNSAEKKKLEAIAKTSRHSIAALGYVDYVDRLMDAADLIVSKPGGLSTSEALAKRLPMLVMDPIPGHEKRNRDFLVSSGAAMTVSRGSDAAALVQEFFTSEELRQSLFRTIDEIRRPHSTEDIGELVMRLCAPCEMQK